MLIDISPPLTPAIKVWPGDSPFTREVLLDIEQGANITLSTLRSTVHLGSHADGPNHYGRGAGGVGEMPLDHYIGPCHLIAVNTAGGRRYEEADLAQPLSSIVHPRILLRTGTYPDPCTFTEGFAALSVPLIESLARRGVRTIGVDTPSVDLFSSKDLPAHAAMLKAGIAIIEGLALRDVQPGEYELLAPPLRLIGFDASPVRAVLRPLTR
ncbi:MAG: cyclase family protein [Phycisphaerales bacterium]